MYSPASSLPDNSRIWIYQAGRTLTTEEVNSIGVQTQQFLESWTAHNKDLRAGYEIRYSRFLILMADEQVADASGCSIDKSVHFIQSLEKQYGISFMDRMQFAYKMNDQVDAVSRTGFEKLFADGIIDENVHVFNNLVDTKGALETAWEVPVKESWHKQLLNIS